MARQRDAVVVLKGPGTVIAAPDGTCFVDVEGGPALATAGSGDVLSGIIGALLARAHARGDIRGVADAARMAAAGCWMHGRAGHIAGAEGQPVTASALIDSLARAIATG
jgi:NAD(P)H-hydrate repair Nnr-like enzyme with NAD(P)H-hydrate dehydratase domain